MKASHRDQDAQRSSGGKEWEKRTPSQSTGGLPQQAQGGVPAENDFSVLSARYNASHCRFHTFSVQFLYRLLKCKSVYDDPITQM